MLSRRLTKRILLIFRGIYIAIVNHFKYSKFMVKFTDLFYRMSIWRNNSGGFHRGFFAEKTKVSKLACGVNS